MKIDFKLDSDTIELLIEYSNTTKKPIDLIIKEALDEYFIKIEKEKMEKNLEDNYNQTNLSYDEFWDGVDI